MGKSYRRPYAAMCGNGSAKRDKVLAHRGERHANVQALRDCKDWEEFVPPLRRECTHNNVYSWSRDGKQRYQGGVWRNLYNLYYFSSYSTEEQCQERLADRIARYHEWQRLLRRK